MNSKKQTNKNKTEVIRIRKQIRNGKEGMNLVINIELKPSNITITNRPIVRDTDTNTNANRNTNTNRNRNRNANTNAGNGGAGGGGGINGGGGGGTFGGGGGGVSISRS